MGEDMKLILVVEDEPDIARVLEAYLRQHGFQTERAADGESALALWRAARPDLVLLDIMMPGLDGVEVLKKIRGQSTTPVIMLTARSEELDKVLGLELGADDYITKPFRPREVVARIKAVLRRTEGGLDRSQSPIRVGPLEVDPLQMLALANGQDLGLTNAEFRLLQHLADSAGRVFSRAELLAAALPESEALERVIDVHMRHLRRKLEAAGVAGLVQTVRGVGYLLAPEHAP
jgi:two-component system response regulator AdeR